MGDVRGQLHVSVLVHECPAQPGPPTRVRRLDSGRTHVRERPVHVDPVRVIRDMNHGLELLARGQGLPRPLPRELGVPGRKPVLRDPRLNPGHVHGPNYTVAVHVPRGRCEHILTDGPQTRAGIHPGPGHIPEIATLIQPHGGQLGGRLLTQQIQAIPASQSGHTPDHVVRVHVHEERALPGRKHGPVHTGNNHHTAHLRPRRPGGDTEVRHGSGPHTSRQGRERGQHVLDTVHDHRERPRRGHPHVQGKPSLVLLRCRLMPAHRRRDTLTGRIPALLDLHPDTLGVDEDRQRFAVPPGFEHTPVPLGGPDLRPDAQGAVHLASDSTNRAGPIQGEHVGARHPPGHAHRVRGIRRDSVRGRLRFERLRHEHHAVLGPHGPDHRHRHHHLGGGRRRRCIVAGLPCHQVGDIHRVHARRHVRAPIIRGRVTETDRRVLDLHA